REIDVQGLTRAGSGVARLEVAAGEVVEQCAMRGRGRRGRQGPAEAFGGGKAAGQETDGGRFDIALAAGDLAGEAQPRHGVEPQRRVEEFWRVEEGIAVQSAEPCELGFV